MKIIAEEHGGALLEGALLMPVLLLLTLGIVYFDLEYWAALSLNQATFTAARCRAVDATKCPSDAAARTLATNSASTVNSGNPTFRIVSCANRVTQSSGPTLPATVTLAGSDQTSIRIMPYFNLTLPLQSNMCFYRQS
jgi:Flp pilus assembly protein TadG